jgi:hypothetical protein
MCTEFGLEYQMEKDSLGDVDVDVNLILKGLGEIRREKSDWIQAAEGIGSWDGFVNMTVNTPVL